MTGAPPDPILPLGAPVRYRRSDDGVGIAEITPPRCPGCAATWGPGQVQLGHAGQRTYRCTACKSTYRAASPSVDEDGHRVIEVDGEAFTIDPAR